MKKGRLAIGEQRIEITRTRVAGQVVGRAVNKRDRALNNRTGGHFGATSLQSVEASRATEAAVALGAYSLGPQTCGPLRAGFAHTVAH